MTLKLLLIFISTFSFLNVPAFSKSFLPIKMIPKVIYGTDDRYDVYESSDSLMRTLSKSTAAKIQNSDLFLENDLYTIKSETLADRGICKYEPFANQIIAAKCSGFLVSSDTLVTAGHCILSVDDCKNHSWVFDFANEKSENSSFTFTKNQVFHCTNIISREKNTTTFNDFAIIKLDRPVPGRQPLKFRTSGKVADDAVFTVIGHPSGLPLKITSAADMRDNTNPVFFKTNSDTYGGNSGSAVVDSRTGIVEGILVRGDVDYVQSEGGFCLISSRHDVFSGRGEDVTRITNISVLLKK